MRDEFSDRHQAIRLRLASQPVEHICQALGRSREWFHIWWRRYQDLGVTGLFDLTRATHQPPPLCALPAYLYLREGARGVDE